MVLLLAQSSVQDPYSLHASGTESLGSRLICKSQGNSLHFDPCKDTTFHHKVIFISQKRHVPLSVHLTLVCVFQRPTIPSDRPEHWPAVMEASWKDKKEVATYTAVISLVKYERLLLSIKLDPLSLSSCILGQNRVQLQQICASPGQKSNIIPLRILITLPHSNTELPLRVGVICVV